MGKGIEWKIWRHLSKKLLKSKIITVGELSDIKNMVYPEPPKNQPTKPSEIKTSEPIKPVTSKPITTTTPLTPKLNYSLPSGEDIANKRDPKTYSKTLICITGFGWSGSSTLVGYFSEFNNTTVMGHVDSIYCPKGAESKGAEFTFLGTVVSPLLDILMNPKKTALQKDHAIKQFIERIYTAYNAKGPMPWAKRPELNCDEFLNMTYELLFSILDLSDETKNILKEQRFPIYYKNVYENCSITKGPKGVRYIFYTLKEMPTKELIDAFKKYVREIFGLIDSKEFLVCDQMALTLPTFCGRLSRFLPDFNVKEICVFRDPRDQYLSRFKSWMNTPRTLTEYVDFYKNKTKLQEVLNSPNPDRLVLRFEDIVTKYEECTKLVRDFVGISQENHTAPKTYFDPSISINNIGAYKDFHDQEFMDKLTESLSEFCWNGEIKREEIKEETKEKAGCV